MVRKFVALFDTHYGHESKGGHKRPIHDPKAIAATLSFISDFRPHDLIFGGDILDCGAVSHHTKGKAGQREGLRLLADAEGCKDEIITPALASLPKGSTAQYIIGNHEDWLDDLVDQEMGLEGILSLKRLLGLPGVDIIPQGGTTHLGKLWFAHGDQIKGGEHVAKAAVTYYNRNIAFGHHHTFQTFTATSAVDAELPKVGLAIPCLCRKDPYYGGGKPNRWAQGFLWGYTFPDGNFTATVTLVVKGRFHAEGKTYVG